MAYVVFQHSGGGTTMSEGKTAREVSFTMNASTSPGGNASSLTGLYSSVPSNAVIQSAKYNISCSINSPASSKNKFYFLKTQDGTTTFFSGNPYQQTSNQSTWNSSSGYYKGTNGGEVSFTGGWSYFPGKSSLAVISKVAHQTSKDGNKAYYRGQQVIVQFYTPCSNPTNVSAQGSLKKLTGTWTFGTAGIDDTVVRHEICYNTSKTWNDATTSTVTTSPKQWTITNANTYYVGVRVVGSLSGTHSPVWSSGAYVSTFTPTLVTKGNKILASDYNQIQTVYSVTAMTAGTSKIDDANIAAVRNHNTNVEAAPAGGVVTADYFNQRVLGRIT